MTWIRQIYLIALVFSSLGIALARTRFNTHINRADYHLTEERGANGDAKGEYGYRTPDGCLHVVRYEARKGGYRVLGTDKRDCMQLIRRPQLPLSTTAKPTTITTTSTTTTTTTTTTSTTTTTTTRKPKKPHPAFDSSRSNSGKQLFESVEPPEEFKRPSVLGPDDPEPVYSFGYEAPGHGHIQAGLPGGGQKGVYFWDTPEGWRFIVTYEANERGFYPKIKRVRTPGAELKGREGRSGTEPEKVEPKIPEKSNGCPYYFFTNTRINYHWERCLLNGTRVGAYGRLADDGYVHHVKYYADARGFRPTLSREVMTEEQKQQLAEITEGAFIIPKIEEEKQETERRIEDWVNQNEGLIENPLS